MGSFVARWGAAAVLLLSSTSALAVYCPSILYDPSAFVKNTIMAEEGIAATAARAAANIQRYEQYVTQLAQLKSIPGQLPGAAAAKAGQELASMRQLLASLRQMQGGVQQVRARMSGRIDEVKALGMSWDKYIQHEQQRIDRNVKLARDRAAEEARALNQVARDFELYRDVASQVPESAGMHESMQQLNVQANMMIVQSAQLARILAPAAASAGSVTEARQQKNERATRQLNQMQHLHDLSRARAAGERRATTPSPGTPGDQ